MADDADSRAFRAGWLRVALGVMGLVSLPAIGIDRDVLMLGMGLYVVAALLQQLLLWLRRGGELRTWIGGIADVSVLTFLVHRVGATSTAMIALYVVIPLMFAMAGRHRVAYGLGVYGAAAYAMTLVAESLGWLPTGPDMPGWAMATRDRPLAPSLAWAAIVATTTMLATAMVVRLARALAHREAELLRANAKLEQMSQRDPLTQLFNRRHLMARISEELERVRRGHPAALVMLDLDRFKAINDGLGHLAGDEVLRAVARAMERCVRKTDVAGRYGGDEFAVLLSDTSPREVAVVGERLLTAIREAGRVDEAHSVTASVGVTLARASDEPKLLIQRADENAYAAKQAGGDRVAGP